MTPEDKIINLGERVHRLQMMDELDKQKAKAERTERTTAKREIEATRKTLRVRKELNAYVLAEEITDPIKFRRVVRAGLFHRWGGDVFVRVNEARELGYTIIEE